MINFDEYHRSLAEAVPPAGLDPAQQALWWVGKGEWDRAHECAQQQEGEPRCDWVHAHLHRVEGDLANAGYWYRRAGKPLATGAIADEWSAIAQSIVPAARH